VVSEGAALDRRTAPMEFARPGESGAMLAREDRWWLEGGRSRTLRRLRLGNGT